MSQATITATPDDFDDRGLAAFLAQVPAAADYDRDEFDRLPRLPRRTSRAEADRQAIAESIEDHTTGTGWARESEAVAAPLPTWDGFAGFPMNGRKRGQR